MDHLDKDEVIQRSRIGNDYHSGRATRSEAASAHSSATVAGPIGILCFLRTPSISLRLQTQGLCKLMVRDAILPIEIDQKSLFRLFAEVCRVPSEQRLFNFGGQLKTNGDTHSLACLLEV